MLVFKKKEMYQKILKRQNCSIRKIPWALILRSSLILQRRGWRPTEGKGFVPGHVADTIWLVPLALVGSELRASHGSRTLSWIKSRACAACLGHGLGPRLKRLWWARFPGWADTCWSVGAPWLLQGEPEQCGCYYPNHRLSTSAR